MSQNVSPSKAVAPIIPSTRLLTFIAQGLQIHAQQSTVAQLGDRTSYVGISDISTAKECTRFAVLRKMSSQETPVTLENYTHILKRQLTLQRGHWLEEGIGNALYANGFQVIPQLEIAVTVGNVPIMAHLDFVLVGHNAIRILELKSTENLPKNPYSNHELQIHAQTALLHEYWHDPVFSVRDVHGTLLHENKTFPEVCQAYLGVQVDDNADVQGWLLCVSMSEARAFGPYIPSLAIAQDCFAIAQNYWQCVQRYAQNPDTNTIPHAKGFCLFCTFCEYANACPKFTGTALPEWEDTFAELEKLKTLKEDTIKEISVLEEKIKQTIFPTDLKGQWLEAGQYRFRVVEQQGRKSFSKEAFTAELTPFMTEGEVSNLLENCEIAGAPFARLYTKTINA